MTKQIFDYIYDYNLEAIKSLIENGADVNVRDEYGDTPLHYCSSINSSEITKLLIENGADVNAKNDGGNTPFHECVHCISPKAAKLLIENGADVNVKNNYGMMPLSYYSSTDLFELAKLLRQMKNETDVNVMNEYENTALDIAINNHGKLLKLFDTKLNNNIIIRLNNIKKT